MATSGIARMRPTRATMVGLAVVFVSFLAKAWMAYRFPLVPVSDFQRLVEFADLIVEQGPFARSWHWSLAAPGVPMAMSIALAVSDADNVAVARWWSTIAMAAVPLLPLFMLRGVVPGWARVLATALIGLLPAQIVFAQVPAQDTWVQLPVVALACLAVRNLRGVRTGAPAWAAVLYWASVYTRPEMLLAALPIAAAAAWPASVPARRVRAAAVFAVIALGLLGATAVQRGKATDHYALSSPHGGASMLGSYVPGVGFGWTQPEAWVATFDPATADDPLAMRENASKIAWHEIAKRPWFHLQRRVGALLYTGTGMDGSITYWTLLDTAQAPERSVAASRLASRLEPPLHWAFVFVHALFVGAMFVALRRRDPVLLALIATIGMKLALHLLFASQARFFLVITALESIAIAVAAADIARDRIARRYALACAAVGGVFIGGGMLATPAWQASLDDPAPQMLERFVLARDAFEGKCQLQRGKLLHRAASAFGFQVTNADPKPGELARVECSLVPREEGGAFSLEIRDAYAPGGFPDRLVQEAWVDGVQVYHHDIAAEAGDGWWTHKLEIHRGRAMQIVVQIAAVRPDAGPAWGNAAATDVRFVDAAD